MKKYILSAAAFLMIAGIAGAQTTTKTSTEKPMAKMHKTTTAAKKPAVNTSVSSTATPAANKSVNSTATIKRKHHKKAKSVPASK